MMNKYFYLFSLLASLPTYTLAAVDCATPPTCSELGYTDDAAKCDKSGKLYCPFDRTKVFCRSYQSVPCDVGAKVYSDLKCYAKTPTSYLTEIGKVFDRENRLIFVLTKVNSYTWDQVQNYCVRLAEASGLSWNMIDQTQLRTLYSNRNAISLGMGAVWSSNSSDTLNAYAMSLNDGSFRVQPKSNKYYGACVLKY